MELDGKLKFLAPHIIRIGIALVYIWFGIEQITNTGNWIGVVPDWALNMSPVGAETIVLFNGAFEVVLGLALLLGIFTRLSALLLALHMIPIVASMGYSGIGVRDFGITVATLGIALWGKDQKKQ